MMPTTWKQELMAYLPNQWVSIYPVSKKWDAELNRLMDDDAKLTPGDTKYTCFLGPQKVWIANYPAAYGSPDGEDEAKILPRRATKIRLRDYIRSQTPKEKWED